MKAKFLMLTFLLTSLISINSFSQVNQQWLSAYSGPGSNIDEAHSLALDVSGNVYVTGASAGTGTGRDYATVKYNSAGLQLWTSRYNGEGGRDDFANSIAADGSGNVYVTGWSNVSATGRDYLTIKYNSSGDSLWVRRYSGLPTSFNDEATSVAVDGSGNVFVTGYSVNGTNSDYATIKYNSAGVQQWVSIYNGPGNGSDNASSLTLDGSSNVYVTGNSVGISTGGDFATVKYNSSGVQQWASRYSGLPINLADGARDIAVDLSGNVYVTGESGYSGASSDYATVKYNSSGVQQWASRYNGPSSSADVGNSLAVDGSGNVYVTGSSIGIGTLDDYTTIKYNSIGVEQWVRRYDGPVGNAADRAFDLALDGAGNIYVTGESSGEVTDYFRYETVKYNSSGDSLWVKGYGELTTGHDRSYAIAVDVSGSIYVTGKSVSGSTSDDYVTIKYTQNPYAVITVFIEGFYDSFTDNMTGDSLKVYLRNTAAPYSIVDSAKSILDSTGTSRFYFSNVANSVNYYLNLRHRNSIETWSNTGYYFSAGILTYNFSNTAGKAFGSNQILIDSSPIRYGIYSGDINQDGFVNLTDVVAVYNSSSNFITGYISTDVNGNNIVDLTDVVIAYNNSSNFVSMVIP